MSKHQTKQYTVNIISEYSEFCHNHISFAIQDMGLKSKIFIKSTVDFAMQELKLAS